MAAQISMAVALLALYWLYQAFQITRNYLKAHQCGFPIVISPVDHVSPFWILPSIFILPLMKRLLPETIWRPFDMSTYGLEWRDHVAGRTRPSSYFLVAPGNLHLFVEDPEIANAMLAKRKQFTLDPVVKKIMGVVGANMVASDGEDWQRQRRLIAPMLNERIMDKVWKESEQQAGDMLGSFMNNGGTTTGTINGLRRIAFNVLQCIGYGQPQEWGHSAREVQKGYHMAYMDALHELIDGFLLIALVPSRLLSLPFLPSMIKNKWYALQDFLVYTQELLQKERIAAQNSDEPRSNLLSLLSTISEKNTKGKLLGSANSENQLSDDEVTGNLYQFTLAGYDTTANTLAYAVTMLAAFPEWQDWIIEEIDALQREYEGKDVGYAEIFSKMERCLALMYETLRRFTPVAHITRECACEQTVRSAEKVFKIPAGTTVTIVLQGVHEQIEIWGDDQSAFRPTRWIDPAVSSIISPENSSSSIPQAPNLQPPAKGAFLPWSTGPRICPGMKMAQVEFLSVIWTIFRKYRVEAARVEGENLVQAQNRLKGVVNDSGPRITLQMNKPEDAVMTWRKRERVA